MAGSATHVLVVDDDRDVRKSLERGLLLSGFEVATCGDGAEALHMAATIQPGVIVLDTYVSALNGVGVVTALRAMDNNVPVCVLTSRNSVDGGIAGLEAGADDYLLKPFVFADLVARIRALLRRSTCADEFAVRTASVGPLELNISGRQASVNGTEVQLTTREFDLLATLAQHSASVLSRPQLLRLVWGYDFNAHTDVVDMFVGYVRRKLEAGGAPRLLHTVRGEGFVLRAT